MQTYIQEFDVMIITHSCVTDNLVSVPIGYVFEELDQCMLLRQSRGVAHESLNSHVGKTWKKLARIPITVGAKRGFQGSESDQVDGLCKGGKRGKFVANEFPIAEADDQPCRAQ